AFAPGALTYSGGSRHIRRLCCPCNLEIFKFISCTQPFGRIGNPLRCFSACTNLLHSGRVERPKGNISNVAPKIGKHPARIVQEIPVIEMTPLREIFRVWCGPEPHIPVER